MSWITKWQDYVGFGDRKERKLSSHPGRIDNSDIIEPYHKTKAKELLSTILEEFNPDLVHQNY